MGIGYDMMIEIVLVVQLGTLENLKSDVLQRGNDSVPIK